MSVNFVWVMITSVKVPSKVGEVEDIVLGFDDIEGSDCVFISNLKKYQLEM